MLIQCKSCQKKFVVPDAAITINGRLVQCSSCGNKWTQFPLENIATEIIENSNSNIKKEKPKKKVIKTVKKKKATARYSKEFLKQKYGLKISDAINVDSKKKNGNNTNGFGFYSYLITLLILIVTIAGIVHLTKEIIIVKFPSAETYIDYFFDTIMIVSTIISDLINETKLKF